MPWPAHLSTPVPETMHDILIIAREDLRQTFRSTKAVLLLGIYALLSLLTGALVILISRTAAVQIETATEGVELPPELAGAGSRELQEEITRQVLEVFVDDPALASYLAGIPLVILFFFWANRTFLPWLAALIGFDALGRDIESGTVRYLTLRTRRSSLVLGRFFANAILLGLLTAATHLLIFGFGILWIDEFPGMSAAGQLFRFWLLVLPVGTAWLAFMLLVSALVRPYPALLVGIVALLGTVMAGWLTNFWGAIEPLRWMLPRVYGGYLLSPNVQEQLIGVGVFTLATVVFVIAALLTLERRDV